MAPKYISQHKHCTLYVRKLTPVAYESLLDTLVQGEHLYALFDVLKPTDEFMAEKAELEGLSPEDIAYGSTPSILRTVFMRVDSKDEFESQPWSRSGWVWFYAVPEWYACEASL